LKLSANLTYIKRCLHWRFRITTVAKDVLYFQWKVFCDIRVVAKALFTLKFVYENILGILKLFASSLMVK